MTTTDGVSTVLVAVDTRSKDVSAAEHVVHDLDQALGAADLDAYVASTHVVRDDLGPHLAVAAGWLAPAAAAPALLDRVASRFPGAGVAVDRAGWAGPADLVAGARSALAEHRSRQGGRLVRFPGQAEIERRLTVEEVLALSCVDVVSGLAGVEINPRSELDLTGFVRPTWHDGQCTVLVQQSVHGLIPFEVRDQIPCCAAH